MRYFKYALIAVGLLLPLTALADGLEYGYTLPYIDISGINQIDNVSVNPNIAAPGNFTTLTATSAVFTSSSISGSLSPTGSINTQGIVFSSVLNGNPLLLDTVQTIPTASVNAAGGQVLLVSVAGRTLYPSDGLSIMAVGTASGATSERLVCQPSGRLVATFNIAQLVTSVPVGPQSASVVAGSGLNNGCNSGDALFLSNVGSNLATTTSLIVNIPYTVQ